MDNLHTRFQQIYANLPLNQRKEIVVVLEDEPLTWNAVKIEVDSPSEKSKQILEQLVRLKILE